jgi:hypothetical protein
MMGWMDDRMDGWMMGQMDEMMLHNILYFAYRATSVFHSFSTLSEETDHDKTDG